VIVRVAVVERHRERPGRQRPGPAKRIDELAERHDAIEYADPARAAVPAATLPDPAAVDEVATILSAARNPIIITKAVGRDRAAVPALVRLAETLGAPVFDQFHTYVNFPQDHPLHGGFEAAPHLDEADAILVIESDVPWFPQLKRPRPETRVIHLGVDPLFSRYPVRGFPTDAEVMRDVEPVYEELPGWAEEIRARTIEALQRENVAAIPGIRDVVDLHAAAGRPYCVASSGRIEKMHATLGSAGLLPLFADVLFSATMVGRGKPAPDLFLHAAQAMGHPPQRCVVIEDSLPGVQAAIAAGMRVCAYAAAPYVDADRYRALGAEVFDDMRRLPRLLGL